MVPPRPKRESRESRDLLGGWLGDQRARRSHSAWSEPDPSRPTPPLERVTARLRPRLAGLPSPTCPALHCEVPRPTPEKLKLKLESERERERERERDTHTASESSPLRHLPRLPGSSQRRRSWMVLTKESNASCSHGPLQPRGSSSASPGC